MEINKPSQSDKHTVTMRIVRKKKKKKKKDEIRKKEYTHMNILFKTLTRVEKTSAKITAIFEHFWK